MPDELPDSLRAEAHKRQHETDNPILMAEATIHCHYHKPLSWQRQYCVFKWANRGRESDCHYHLLQGITLPETSLCEHAIFQSTIRYLFHDLSHIHGTCVV